MDCVVFWVVQAWLLSADVVHCACIEEREKGDLKNVVSFEILSFV